jgi:activator of HSP90 ATPase
MTKTIRQTVKFRATPKRLFALYLDAKEHSAFSGCPTKVSAKVGAPFRAMDYITGRNLVITPEQQIVQSWRADDWRKGDLDSVLILNFRKIPTGVELEMIHAGVPERHAKALADGWRRFYWAPIKKHLAG